MKESKQSFFENKDQKTFIPLSPRQPSKSFLLLFFKKEVLFLLLVFLSNPAFAQVATDDRALDSLPAAKPAAPAPPRPVHHPIKSHAPPKKLQAVKMPPAPPANPVLAPPPFVMPAHPPPPPPPVPVRADAIGTASPVSGGRTRITFGPGAADLNPATLAAIRAVAARAAANPTEQLGVTAWALGTSDDPSTPRRLSLDRALAVRAVLINAGIVSDRIRVVAKGMADYGDGIADRADIAELPPTR